MDLNARVHITTHCIIISHVPTLLQASCVQFQKLTPPPRGTPLLADFFPTFQISMVQQARPGPVLPKPGKLYNPNKMGQFWRLRQFREH